MPKVIHEDETPQEREARALLDEAMGRPTETYPTGTAPDTPITGTTGTTHTYTTPTTIHDTTMAEGAVVDRNREHARSLVDRADEALGRTAHRADAALTSPAEIRGALDERNAKPMTETIGDKVKGAMDTIR